MDNVLFYGERDEHTRRQVRSAAAAHSHRIGPRKPKTAGKQSNGSSKSETTVRRKTTPKHGSKSDSVVEATMSSSQERPAPSTPSTFINAGLQHGWDQSRSFHQTQAHFVGPPAHELARPHSATRSPPEQQLQGGIASPGARSMSPASQIQASPPETQRLPAYSWTEYPRYGLGSNRLQSLEVLADVAASARVTARSSSPAAGNNGVPEFRLFKSSVEERSALPPLPVPTSSPSLMHNNRGGVRVSKDDQIKSEVAEMAPYQAPCAEFIPHPSRTPPHFHSMSPG